MFLCVVYMYYTSVCKLLLSVCLCQHMPLYVCVYQLSSLLLSHPPSLHHFLSV